MMQMSKFVPVSDMDIRFGLWKYTGGVVRFSGGRMFVAKINQKKVDTAGKR